MKDAPDYFSIGTFQIENLVINHMPFVFLDLREDPTTPEDLLKTPEQLGFWRKARATTPDLALKTAQQLALSPSMAILLLCEDGRISAAVATQLGVAGFLHVLIVDGGLQQLRRDWTVS